MSKLFWITALAAFIFAARAEDKWQDSFNVDEKDFVSTGHNDYFILEPGYRLTFAGEEDGQKATLVVTVTQETKKIGAVETRVVEEREAAVDGKLIEVSRNYFAIDKKTNDVYYFGEDVDMYKNGAVVNHEGSWLSGTNGAKFGLMMPAKPKVGDRFYHELAPKVAMDRSVIDSLTETVETPAGKFENCLKMTETSGVDPKENGHKRYAPGIGLVWDSDFKLVKHEKTVLPAR